MKEKEKILLNTTIKSNIEVITEQGYFKLNIKPFKILMTSLREREYPFKTIPKEKVIRRTLKRITNYKKESDKIEGEDDFKVVITDKSAYGTYL